VDDASMSKQQVCGAHRTGPLAASSTMQGHVRQICCFPLFSVHIDRHTVTQMMSPHSKGCAILLHI
jgi:hypothetical protein